MPIKTRILVFALLAAISINLIYYKRYVQEAWMKLRLSNETIVISMSTTPYRIDHLRDTLDTIFDQNRKPDAIYISVPYFFKRDNVKYEIPQWLKDETRVTILRTTDYGPGTKLLGVLEKAKLEPDAIIITVDDDVRYPRNLVLQLAYQAKLHPNSAIGIIGADIDYDARGNIPIDSLLGYKTGKRRSDRADVLKGYGGVAYRKKFFDQSVFDIQDFPADCIKSDDIYLSFYLAKHNIRRQTLRNTYIHGCSIDWHTEIGTDEHALHQLIPSPGDKHRACISYLKSHNPNVLF